MSSLDRFVDRSASSSRDRATPPTGHVDVDVGQVFPIGSTGASWSPDGKQIAYVASLDGNVHIYTMRSDGTDVRRLTTDLGHDKDPSATARYHRAPRIVEGPSTSIVSPATVDS